MRPAIRIGIALSGAWIGISAIVTGCGAATSTADSPESIPTAVALPAFFAILPSNTHLVSLSEYHSFSATTQNEFRAAYSRNYNRRSAPDFTYPGLDSFPTLAFDDIRGLQLGANPANPNGQIQDELQLSDTITATRGRHTLKIGYDFRDIILSTSFVSNPRGYYDYLTLEHFLLDLSPDSFGLRFLGTTGPLVNGMPAGFLQNAAFVQDDLRVTAELDPESGRALRIRHGSRALPRAAVQFHRRCPGCHYLP